jgi:CheY-like chemotaxis protein
MTEQSATNVASRAPRVLVLEDDGALREAIARDLGSEFEVVGAASYREALTLFDAGGVRAVIADYDLRRAPQGRELLLRVRHRAPSCPRILLSARSDIDSNVAHQFIGKPWRRGEIRDAIRHLLRQLPSQPEPIRRTAPIVFRGNRFAQAIAGCCLIGGTEKSFVGHPDFPEALMVDVGQMRVGQFLEVLLYENPKFIHWALREAPTTTNMTRLLVHLRKCLRAFDGKAFAKFCHGECGSEPTRMLASISDFSASFWCSTCGPRGRGARDHVVIRKYRDALEYVDRYRNRDFRDYRDLIYKLFEAKGLTTTKTDDLLAFFYRSQRRIPS